MYYLLIFIYRLLSIIVRYTIVTFINIFVFLWCFEIIERSYRFSIKQGSKASRKQYFFYNPINYLIGNISKSNWSMDISHPY